MSKAVAKFVVSVAIVLVVLTVVRGRRETTTTYPNRPIELVVPFKAAGGSDTFARFIEKAIEENKLLPQPIVISNVGGAGATIGSRRVKDAKPDGYTVLILHEALITAKYYGQVEYGPEAFEPVAGTGRIGLVVAVWEDSPYRNLTDLLEDAKQRPDTLVFAANLGAPAHFVGLMLERHFPGARFRFTQSGGGADRFADLKGGHADVSVFSVQEYEAFKSKPDSNASGIRAIAVCQPERHAAAPDVPTTHEQGVPVTHINMQFWWVPKGTPRSRIDVLSETLEKAMQTDSVREEMAKIHCEPIYVTGSSMQQEVEARNAAISKVDLRPARSMPDVSRFVFVGTIALAILVGLSILRERKSASRIEWSRLRLSGAAGFGLLAVGYVTVLASRWIDFRDATAVFVLLVGGLLTRLDSKMLPILVVAALMMSLGIHFIFTHAFELTLP